MAVAVVVVFFTLTDRASTIPSNIRGCQSGTVRGLLDRKRSEEHLQAPMRASKTQQHKNKRPNKKYQSHAIKRWKRGTRQIERVWFSAGRELSHPIPSRVEIANSKEQIPKAESRKPKEEMGCSIISYF